VSLRLRLPTPARGSSEAATYRLGSSTRPLAQASSEAAMCHEDMLYMPQTIKQIPPGGPTIMIFIEARVCVSSKALCNKGCSARLQGVRQAAH
jgi:hypothetical protein